jgi:steroid delta-isomerase-like uncharacterized protein
MSEENKTLVRRWFEEVWNQGRTEAIDQMFAEDGIAYGLSNTPGEEMRGPADFKIFHAAYRGAFPDVKIQVEDIIAEGDKVAARCSVKGKHSGDHLGFKATNVDVGFEGITIVRIRDQKIVEAWNHFDFMNMHRQMGTLHSVAGV